MLNAFKEKMVSTGMSLVQSPFVAKLMESEQFGTFVEKAMAVPFKVSGAISSNREKLVALLDLATQQDLDELRRGISRMEGLLKDIRKESGDLLRGVGESPDKNSPIAH